MLTDDQIRSRRMRFGCCALDYLDKYIEASIHGDIKCARLNWGMYLKMWFAKCVMDNTAIGSESKCGTVAYATKIAKKYDCFCNCPCPQTQDEDCVIDVAFTVIDAISFDDLPAEPEDGDNYLITEGDFTGRIATWQSGDDAQWIISVVGVFNVVQTEAGVYYINIGNGPGLLFPSLTMELTGGPETWTVSIVNDYDTTTGRAIQLEGLGSNGWYAMWQGTEADLPLNVNLQGLPFTQVRLRYILANECQYVSGVGTTIPEIDDGGDPLCGTFDYTVIEDRDPVTGMTVISIDVSNVAGYPFGPSLTSVDGSEYVDGPQIIEGINNITTIGPGQIADIIITNSFDAGCNVALAPITADCGTIDVATEVIQNCEGDPAQWGVMVTITNNDGYVVNSVKYETPAGAFDASESAPGVWVCGPLGIDDDPGPMTITILNAYSKVCLEVVGPFEPAECPGDDVLRIECEDTPQFLVMNLDMQPAIQDSTPIVFEEPESGLLSLQFLPYQEPLSANSQMLFWLDDTFAGAPYAQFASNFFFGQILPLEFEDGLTYLFGSRDSNGRPVETILAVATCSTYSYKTAQVYYKTGGFVQDCEEDQAFVRVLGFWDDNSNVGQYRVRYSLDGITWSDYVYLGWMDFDDPEAGYTLLPVPAWAQSMIIEFSTEEFPGEELYQNTLPRASEQYCEGCAPEVDYTGEKFRAVIDLSDLPDPSLVMYNARYIFIASDEDSIGTFPVDGWLQSLETFSGSGIWEWTITTLSPGDEGFVWADLDGFLWIIANDFAYTPVPFAFTPILNGNLLTTQNSSEYTIPTNRPVIVQVRVGGLWQTVWTGLEEDFIALGDGPGTPITVPAGASAIQAIYDYETCPIYAVGAINP